MAELVMSAAEIAQDRDRWLAVRREGITATDAAVIMGVSPWDSPFALWHRKKGNLPEHGDSDRFRLARYLEEYVWELWQEANGRADETDALPSGTDEGGLYRDGWRMASPDFLLFDDIAIGSGRCTAVVECKTVASWEGWGRGLGHMPGSPDWVSDETKQADGARSTVPDYVRVQVLWQCDVLGVPVGHVAALHRSSGEFRWYTIKADPLAYEPGGIRDKCQLFMESLEAGVPPPVDGAEATTAALKALHHVADPPAICQVPEAIADEYDRARELVREAEARLDAAKNLLRGMMGDAKYADVGERRVAYRSVSKVAGHWVAPHERDVLMPARRKAGE